jgi:hypothetical protein
MVWILIRATLPIVRMGLKGMRTTRKKQMMRKMRKKMKMKDEEESVLRSFCIHQPYC